MVMISDSETVKRNLEDLKNDGLQMSEDTTIGFFTTMGTSNFFKLLNKNCGDIESTPLLTLSFSEKVLEKLKNYRKKIEIDEELDINEHDVITVGNSRYSAQRIYEILMKLGTKNVNLYQKCKDSPLGIKTENGKAFLAPIINFQLDSTSVVFPTIQQFLTRKELK